MTQRHQLGWYRRISGPFAGRKSGVLRESAEPRDLGTADRVCTGRQDISPLTSNATEERRSRFEAADEEAEPRDLGTADCACTGRQSQEAKGG